MSTSDKSGPPPGLLRRAWNFAMDLLDVLIRPSSVFGLGVLTQKGSREDEIVAEMIAPYQVALLGILERNRLANYLKVIELQDAMNASAKKSA